MSGAPALEAPPVRARTLLSFASVAAAGAAAFLAARGPARAAFGGAGEAGLLLGAGLAAATGGGVCALLLACLRRGDAAFLGALVGGLLVKLASFGALALATARSERFAMVPALVSAAFTWLLIWVPTAFLLHDASPRGGRR